MSKISKIYNYYAKNGIRKTVFKSYQKISFATRVGAKVVEDGSFPYLAKEERSRIVPDIAGIQAFKNRYPGKRCFIVGNGPSLNKMDLSLLENEYSFAVNGIFYKTKEMGFRPSFYMVEDSHVIKDNLEEIDKFHPKIHRFFPTEYKELLKDRDDTSFFTMNRGFYERASPNFGIPRFSTDFALRGYCGQSVTMLNLQLAFYMGFSEVYLIGMDFSYNIPDSAIVTGLNIESTEDDQNHFHPDYFGKGKKWHDPQLEQVLKNYQLAKSVYQWGGRNIYNATHCGHLEVFERRDYSEIMNNSASM
jgi:hypothetical protein